jgi:hypothetical protein
MRILLDPTGELQPAYRERNPRPASLDGKVVGLLDISKARGDIFLDYLDGKLTEMGIAVKRYRKPTFARVAPVDLKHQIVTECDVVIEGLAD